MARSALDGCSLALVTLLVALLPAVARADGFDPSSQPDGTQPIPYSARPLTLPRLVLSPRVDATLDKLRTDTAKAIFTTQNPKTLNLLIGLGASIGIIDNIEVGAVIAPIQVLPTVAYGDPSLHGTFRFVKGSFELAGYFGTTFLTHDAVSPQVVLPVLDSNAGVVLQPGLLSRIHLGSRAKIDIGATVPIELGNGARDLGLEVPLELAVNLAEWLHVGATSGFGISNVKDPVINSYVPLGLIAGFAFGAEKGPVVDLGAVFRWPKFADPGQSQKFDVDDFQAGVSLAAYVYLL